MLRTGIADPLHIVS